MHGVGPIGAALALPRSSNATDSAAWPAGRTVSWVVPYPPGGSTDLLGRSLAKVIGSALDTQIIVDNRPGATGTIGSAFVARAKPDGYTILGTSIGPQAIAPHLLPRLPYRPLDDLQPVILIGRIPHLLVVAGSRPFRTVDALVDAARQRPGTLSFASGGAGTILQMQAEQLAQAADLKLVHVPYKGDTPAIQDTLGGVVDFMFAPVAAALPHVRSGELRALAATSSARLTTLPDVPTMIEAGFANFIVEQWQAVYVPKGTPSEVVTRLHDALANALRQPEIVSLASRLGVTLTGEGPEALARRQRTDSETWGALIRTRGITAD